MRFFCLRSSSNSPSWLISVLQLLCCKHAVVAHSRTSSTFQQVPCQVSVLQRVILPGRHRASRSSRLIAHSTTNHVTIQCTNKHPPLSFDGIHNEEQTQHLFFLLLCGFRFSNTFFLLFLFFSFHFFFASERLLFVFNLLFNQPPAYPKQKWFAIPFFCDPHPTPFC